MGQGASIAGTLRPLPEVPDRAGQISLKINAVGSGDSTDTPDVITIDRSSAAAVLPRSGAADIDREALVATR